MTRPTLIRPPIENIADSDGLLNPEWARSFDELYLWVKEQQNQAEEGGGGGDGVVSDAVKAYVDEQIALATAPTESDFRIVGCYSEVFSMASVTTKAITHNLGTADPLWSVTTDAFTGNNFQIYGTDENTHTLVWTVTAAVNATITLYKVISPT